MVGKPPSNISLTVVTWAWRWARRSASAKGSPDAPNPELSRLRLGFAGTGSTDLRNLRAGDLFGHTAHQVRHLALPYQATALGCRRPGGHVHLFQNRLPPADRLGALGLWHLHPLPDRGQA